MRLFERILTLTLLSLVLSAPAAQAQENCRAVFNDLARGTLSLPEAREIRDAYFAAKPAASRALTTVKELKVLQYNVENLFMSVGKFERLSPEEFRRVTGSEMKPQWQLDGIAKVMRETDPDVMILQEVEGLDALAKFNKDFLASKYRPLLVEGNDERGIDIGFMVKRDLPLQIALESHKEMEWIDPVDKQKHKLFSRDVPALVIRRANEPATATPLLIVMGNHAKSKRDRSGDPLSDILRTAQYKGMAQIINDYRTQYGKDVPMMIAGDFNDTVPTAATVKPVRDIMVDAFDVKGLKGDARVTHTFHPNGGATEYNQIDAVFVNPALASSVVDAKPYRYKDASGQELPLPSTFDERAENPSDHFPVIVRISTKSIFPEAFGQRQLPRQPTPLPQPRPRVAAGF